MGYGSMQEIQQTKHKATEIASNKKTVNVKVYQNTKIHYRQKLGGGSTALERSATHVTGGLNLVMGHPTSRLFNQRPIRYTM